MIAEPKQMAADDDTVKSLTGSLSSLTAERTIDEKPGNLAGLGLATPVEEIDVTRKGGTVDKILIGSDTPSGTDAYAKVESKPAVYTIFSSTKSNFDKSLNDLRDKRLLPFNSDKVTAITITSKGPAFSFGKNAQGEWQIVTPSPMRADSMQVDDLLRKLKDAKMDLAASDEKGHSPNRRETNGTAVVTDNSGPYTINIRQAKDKTYYAKSSAVDGIYKLVKDAGEAQGQGR